MDKETQLIVSILLFDIISMPYFSVLAPTLQKLADNTMGFFSQFCTAVIGRGLMTNPQPRKKWLEYFNIKGLNNNV